MRRKKGTKPAARAEFALPETLRSGFQGLIFHSGA
jgi:hypothetical protein